MTQQIKRILDVKNLTILFNHQRVINDISFSLYQGDQVAIIGANGAGKTTLLKAILNLIHIDQGHISIDKNRRIGYLPQVIQVGDQQFPITVFEVLMQGLLQTNKTYVFSNKSMRERVEFALKEYDLVMIQNHLFGNLSLGQKQLVLFARMMLQEPDIVFLDEPTSSLDIDRKNSLYDILNHLKKNQITYVIVTHDLPSFDAYIERVIYLEHTILFDGDFKTFCENKAFSPFIHTHDVGHHHDDH
jgi:ABC-type Mn2+/Zn2+ transport system ATPase subunit